MATRAPRPLFSNLYSLSTVSSGRFVGDTGRPGVRPLLGLEARQMQGLPSSQSVGDTGRPGVRPLLGPAMHRGQGASSGHWLNLLSSVQAYSSPDRVVGFEPSTPLVGKTSRFSLCSHCLASARLLRTKLTLFVLNWITVGIFVSLGSDGDIFPE